MRWDDIQASSSPYDGEMPRRPPDQPVSAVDIAKARLRAEVRARRRDGLAARDRRAVADSVAEHALALVSARCAPGAVCRVTAYESWGSEPPTEALVAALVGAGHEVIVPITRPDLTLDWRVAGSDVALGADAIASAAVVITPGLSVDHDGRRLGQGGGCYDEALARRHPEAVAVTLVYDEEVVPGPLPAEAHDLPVDGVLTPTGVTLFGSLIP